MIAEKDERDTISFEGHVVNTNLNVVAGDDDDMVLL